MKRAPAHAGLALAMGLGAATAVPAQQTTWKIAEDFAAVCGAAINDVEIGAKEAVRLGYGTIERGVPNKVSNAVAVNGGSGGFTFSEHTFSDMISVSCTSTLVARLDVVDIEAVAERFSRVKGVGPLEGGAGMPAGSINPQNMVFGTYKRVGTNPLITLNTITAPQYSILTVNQIRLTPKN